MAEGIPEQSWLTPKDYDVLFDFDGWVPGIQLSEEAATEYFAKANSAYHQALHSGDQRRIAECEDLLGGLFDASPELRQKFQSED